MREVKHGVEQLTSEEAAAFFDGGAWKTWTDDEVASFQLFQDCLALPFDRFHEAMTAVLKRDIFTHEFANQEALIAEYWGDRPAPSLAEILALIPEEKRIAITL